ncbi:hypothetical protein C8J57DRAFT_1083618 [Mycena rebaudengoi]|nr:hypothetical protein C8J57DRAFT_1083618 [Mycena rebaudengoi]
MDQLTCSRKDLACLTAIQTINGQSAYILYDSGSTMNSLTPEYMHATNAPRIRLTDQVTLQLGCIGSSSRIHSGTRVPVDMGGIKGYVYFDQGNIDRYNGIIGTPLMNQHGLILDFKHRMIRFSNGKVVKALSVLEEAALIAERRAHQPGKAAGGNPNPSSNEN